MRKGIWGEWDAIVMLGVENDVVVYITVKGTRRDGKRLSLR